jgi:ribosomal-protein-serine acetyltransferase
MLSGSPCIKINDQIILKQLQQTDAEKLYLISKENEEELRKWFSWASNISPQNTEYFIKESLTSNKRNDFGIFYEKELIGLISLIQSNIQKKEVELAYWLSKSHRGKGVVTKCCKAIIDYCFNKLGFDEVYVEFFPDNKKSCAVAERLGFELDEFAKKARIINDKRSFYVCYSLKKEDYKNNFWNNLEKIFKKSKIVIDYKKGAIFNNCENTSYPVNFGHLENDWDNDEQLDILIGSDKKIKNIDAILCTMDITNKMSDIKILYQCTEKEKKKLFEIYNKLQGSILVEK